MYSLVLMAALTTGGSSPECCLVQCDPFPCCYNWCYPCCRPCWGYPWFNSYVSLNYYPYCDPCWCGNPCWPVVIQQNGSKKKEEKREREKEKGAKKAKLVVELPAEAKLFIDGTQMKSGSTRRGIVTPPLHPGQTYHYEVRVELLRNGHAVSETQRIRLIPGELVHARFPNLENRAIVQDNR